jgi:hypothetical protein
MNLLNNKIFQFLLLIDKFDGKVKFITKYLEWQEINLEDNHNHKQFVVGHTRDKIEGEFVVIEIYEGSIMITNDIFGSIPIYIYEKESIIAVTNNLDKLSDYIHLDTTVNEQKLFEYFIFGYQISGNESFYKSIKCIQTHFKIYHTIKRNHTSINISDDTIYNGLNANRTNDNKIAKILQKETSEGLKSLKGRSAFLLSGGSDSILGALLCKSIKNDTKLESATFGLNKSLDIVGARSRAKYIIGYKHHEYLIDQLEILPQDYIEHSIAQNGFGTLSSIYYSFFLKHLKNIGFSNAIFSDHFECTRKEIPDVAYLRAKYTTPQIIANRYIYNQTKYDNYLNGAILSISDYYKNNECYKFYFQDRNMRGQSWKMVLCNNFGIVKYNLSNHANFLKENYQFVINQKSFVYNNILNQYCFELNIDEKKLNIDTNNIKSIPMNPKELIYSQTQYFIDLLENNQADDILSYFNTNQIITDIKKKLIPENGEWFILRLLNIIIFNLHVKSKLT